MDVRFLDVEVVKKAMQKFPIEYEIPLTVTFTSLPEGFRQFIKIYPYAGEEIGNVEIPSKAKSILSNPDGVFFNFDGQGYRVMYKPFEFKPSR